MITKTLDRMAVFVQGLDAGPPPMDAPYLGEPVKPPRVLPAYLQREQTLQREIADREAELADVRRARDAATAGLLELEGVPDLAEVSIDTEVFQATTVREGTTRFEMEPPVYEDTGVAKTTTSVDSVSGAKVATTVLGVHRHD
jgi:hypothetical protein